MLPLEPAREDIAQARPPLDARERQKQGRQRIEQIVAHLDEAFHEEPADGAWATQIEDDLAEDFHVYDWSGHALAEARCRSTLCRLVVSHDDKDAISAFIMRMGTLQAFANTEGFYQHVTLADGTPATVIYIAREGFSLPAMPSP
jgi:hypothetical protein